MAVCYYSRFAEILFTTTDSANTHKKLNRVWQIKTRQRFTILARNRPRDLFSAIYHATGVMITLLLSLTECIQ